MILEYGEKKLKLPDFLIIGAARSGTTYLYNVLSRHPQVFMPSEKEPQFFCNYANRKTIVGGKVVKNWQNYNLDQYSSLFKKAKNEQCWGEASVDYLYEYRTTIKKIKNIYKNKAKKLKIIIILRNPADRAWSHYLLRAVKHSETFPFSQSINPKIIKKRLELGLISTFDYFGYGLYANKVEAWKTNFPDTRIWIYEEFFNNIEQSMLELTNFLLINDIDRSLISKDRINSSGVAKNNLAQFFINQLQQPAWWKKPGKLLLPQRFRQQLKRKATHKILQRHDIDPDLRCRLLDLYRDDIIKLETVLSRNLSLWLNNNALEQERFQK